MVPNVSHSLSRTFMRTSPNLDKHDGTLLSRYSTDNVCRLLCAVKQVLQEALGTELGDAAVRALVLLQVQPMEAGEVVMDHVVP